MVGIVDPILSEGCRDLSHRELLTVSLLRRDDWSIGDQREVDSWIGHQVGLELGEVNIESPVEPQGGRDGRHNLANQPVEVGVGWHLDVHIATADVIDGEDQVVRLHHCSGDLGSRVDGKLQLGFLPIVDRKSQQVFPNKVSQKKVHQKLSQKGVPKSVRHVPPRGPFPAWLDRRSHNL